ncbi:OmpA family protein [Lichenicoccus sp.]|uniref:OmpA family protein n=1 Tax=Lichenicoccus sp. TaxID=2781899 RepID=UPI003D1317CA
MSRAARLLPILLCACCLGCNTRTAVPPGPEAPPTPSAGAPHVSGMTAGQPQVAEFSVPVTGGTMCVTSLTYDARVFFDTDRDHPRPGAAPVLAALAGQLRAPSLGATSTGGEPHVAVVGHTDSVGSDAYNLALSRRRAREIVRELVARGLPESEFEAIGVGLREPLPGGDGEEASRARNRRVEFLIGPSRRAVDTVLAARHPSPLALRASHLQVVRVQPRAPETVSRAPLGAAVSY